MQVGHGPVPTLCTARAQCAKRPLYCFSTACGERYWWQVIAGQVSLCPQMPLQPLGDPPTPAPACFARSDSQGRGGGAGGRTVLKTFTTPTEMNVLGHALCFMVKGPSRLQRLAVGGWRLVVSGWWSLGAVLEGKKSGVFRKPRGGGGGFQNETPKSIELTAGPLGLEKDKTARPFDQQTSVVQTIAPPNCLESPTGTA